MLQTTSINYGLKSKMY